MSGGLHFTPEQIRSLPLSMQIKIGLEIAEQLTKTASIEAKKKEGKNGNVWRMAGKSSAESTAVSI